MRLPISSSCRIRLTNPQSFNRKKCKQFKEQAEKQCERRIKEYTKQQQKIEEMLEAEYNPHSAAAVQQQRPSTMLGEWKQRLWSSSQGNLKQAANLTLPSNGHHPLNGGGTKFSALVGGTISGARGTVQRRAQASKQARMQMHGGGGGEFKVGEIEAGSGKRSVRSLQGVQRNSEVLYVGTFSNNGDPLKRGKITDVFDVVEEVETASDQEEGGGGGGRRGSVLSSASRSGRSQLGGIGGRMMMQGTMSRAYSQPDFMAQHLREEEADGDEAEPEVSEEVMMQRPAGLFDRPMLGSLAFR